MKLGEDLHTPAIGGHREILARLRARLAGYQLPHGDFAGQAPLRPLVPAAPSDFTMVQLDAWATLGDLLSFYQARLAAEGYLATATDDASLRALVATLGVPPLPALSASLALSFTVLPRRDRGAVIIPRGTLLQNAPTHGGGPQLFETTAELSARAEWNAMPLLRPQVTGVSLPAAATCVLCSGEPGVALGTPVFVTGRRGTAPFAALHPVRRVERALRRPLIAVAWDRPVADRTGAAVDDVEVRRARAPEPLFGHDAPHWDELTAKERLREGTLIGGLHRLDDGGARWRNLEQGAPLGGDVRCIAAGPGSTIHAGVAGLGLVRSTDGGRTFQPGPVRLRGTELLCLAWDPLGRLIAGTGDRGVLRSADGGATWEVLTGGLTIGEPNPIEAARTATASMLPKTPVRALAGLVGGDGGDSFVLAGTDRGVYAWSDARSTWQAVAGGLPATAISVRAVVADPVTGRCTIATDLGLYAAPQLGAPWVRSDPRAPGAGVACLAGVPGRGVLAGLDDGGLWRDTDGWSEVAGFGARRVRAIHAIAPAGDGAPWIAVACDRGVAISGDGGATWSWPADGLGNRDARAIAVTPDRALLAVSPVLGVDDRQWPGWALSDGELELARTVDQVAPGDLVALVAGGAATAAPARIARVATVATVRRTGFGRGATITRVTLDPPLALAGFDRRHARVHFAAAALPLAPVQFQRYPAIGATPGMLRRMLDDELTLGALTRLDLQAPTELAAYVALDGAAPPLAHRPVLIAGRRLRVRVEGELTGATIVDGDGVPATAAPGDLFELLAPIAADGDRRRWRLAAADGGERVLTAPAAIADRLAIVPADPDGVVRVERRMVRASEPAPGGLRLVLDEPLDHVLDPVTVVVHGNVVEGRHGMTATEVLGSSDGSASQRYRLARAPVAWDDRGGGLVPAIEVRIGGEPWRRVASFAGEGPRARVYRLRVEADGASFVEFGDGDRGARPESGRNNVEATYRHGGGEAGNIPAGSTLLIRTRPAHVKRVDNPLPAIGGAATEAADALRARVPRAMRALDRVVSVADLRDFVLGIPGVARARAGTVWNGHGYEPVVTVATTDAGAGHALAPGSPLMRTIAEALARGRAHAAAVRVLSFQLQRFEVGAELTYAPAADEIAVAAAARAAIAASFGFDRRELAEPVAAAAVVAALVAVPGVRNVRLHRLADVGTPAGAAVPVVLAAADQRFDARARRVEPAGLRAVDPARIAIGRP